MKRIEPASDPFENTRFYGLPDARARHSTALKVLGPEQRGSSEQLLEGMFPVSFHKSLAITHIYRRFATPNIPTTALTFQNPGHPYPSISQRPTKTAPNQTNPTRTKGRRLHRLHHDGDEVARAGDVTIPPDRQPWLTASVSCVAFWLPDFPAGSFPALGRRTYNSLAKSRTRRGP